jgi:hypothetical protein
MFLTRLIRDLGDVVEFVYLLTDLFAIFDTAEVEIPVFPAISAMGIPYSEKSLIAIRNRTLFLFSFFEN